MHTTPTRTLSTLWKLIHEHRWLLILYSLSSLLLNIFPVVLPLFVQQVIDGVVAGQTMQALLPIFWTWLAALIIQHIAFLFSDYFATKSFLTIRNTLYRKVYSTFFSFSLGQHRSSTSGIKLSIVERGIRYFIDTVTGINNILIPSLLRIISTLALLSFIEPLIAVILGSVLLGHIVSWKIFHTYFYKKKATQSESMYRAMEGYKHELIHNVDTVKTMGAEHREMNIIAKKLHDIYTFMMGYRIPLYLFRSTRSLLTQSIYVGIILGSTWLILNGDMTVGTIALISQWTLVVNKDIISITQFEMTLADARAPLEKLAEMIRIPNALVVQNPGRDFPQDQTITFHNVSFGYDREVSFEEQSTERELPPLLFNDLSLTIESGKTTAIVGPSGSGKSSLMRLLLRYFDPQQGSIFIGGIPLTDLDLQSYYRHIGYIPQHIELFSGTLRENITYSHPDPDSISDKMLMKAVQQSNISDFWERLQEGLDTLIGDRGIKLSGGEKQRVAIARALIKSPELFIFDEATSSLDSKSEESIQETIQDITQGKTSIIIAHRLSTIVQSDTILVMNKGQVTAQGNHRDLMHSSCLYRELVKSQLERMLTAQLGHISETQLEAVIKDMQLL